MGHKSSTVLLSIPFVCLLLCINSSSVHSQLDYHFYDYTCPYLHDIVKYGVWQAIMNESRIAASLLRMQFHDCIVDGCDGSVLLDDTNTFKGEKKSFPNHNSVRGYEVIDNIKAQVERACPLTVSCVDILTLATSKAVSLVGGPHWDVPLGRRDSRTASQNAANEQIPSPFESLANITAKFTSKGLDLKDVVVLSGAHTIGFARCFMFQHRLYNYKGSGKPDPTVDSSMLQNLQSMCPDDQGDGDTNKTPRNQLAPLDSVTYDRFDNMYFKNLMSKNGLLESDQALMGDSNFASMVNYYSIYPRSFYDDFAESMVKLGYVGVLTGHQGEIRAKCGSVN